MRHLACHAGFWPAPLILQKPPRTLCILQKAPRPLSLHRFPIRKSLAVALPFAVALLRRQPSPPSPSTPAVSAALSAAIPVGSRLRRPVEMKGCTSLSGKQQAGRRGAGVSSSSSHPLPLNGCDLAGADMTKDGEPWAKITGEVRYMDVDFCKVRVPLPLTDLLWMPMNLGFPDANI